MIDISELTNSPSDFNQLVALSSEYPIDFVKREHVIDTVSFITIDVKLSRFKEDALYNNDQLRLLIPRGLCFIFANNSWVYTLYGHPKFGNFGDYISSHLTTNNMSEYQKIFKTKENGECAHWGAFVHNDITYEVYGSKNVHMVVRHTYYDEDIRTYTDKRYTYAIKMADLINAKPTDTAVRYLATTGYAFCGEGCSTDSQHLVKYEASKIMFFAVTGQRNSITDSIVKVNPYELCELIISLGLKNVKETILVNTDKDETKVQEEYFEQCDNSEGAVVNCIDGTGNTVYVYKHKNYDYVLMRALREQMRKHATTKKIINRLDNLHIIHPDFENKKQQSIEFNAWVNRTLNKTDRETFFERWPDWFITFCNTSQSVKDECLRAHEEYERTVGTLNVIMLMGIPGSGKSFISRALVHILNMNGKTAIHLEQDMFFKQGKGANKSYQNAIKKNMNNASCDYLILAKSNHNTQVRNSTYATLDKCERNVIITYIELSTNSANIHDTGELCVERIMRRGLAHTSLFGLDEDKIRSIIFGVFVKQWEPLTEKEQESDAIHLEINKSKEEIIISLCSKLSDLYLEKFSDFQIDLHHVFSLINNDDNQMIQTNQKH